MDNSMRREDTVILELCKNKPDRSRINSLVEAASFDWPYFLSAISKHKISPIVLDKLLKYTNARERNTFLIQRAKKEIVEMSRQRNIIKTEFNRIQYELLKKDITCILLKGLSLDFSGLRVIGDIDILVRQKNLIKAIHLMEHSEYVYVGYMNRLLNKKEKNNINLQFSWNNQYQLYNRKGSLLLELHTNLFEKTRVYDVNLDALFNNIEVFWKGKRYDNELKCFTLSAEHSVLLMCLHNAIKRSPSNNAFLMRTIVDIDGLVRKGINWSSLTDDSIQFHIVPFVYFSLLFAQRLINTKIPKEVLSALKNRCSRWQLIEVAIHQKCFVSLKHYSIFYSKIYRILSPFVFNAHWKNRIKWLLLIPILFPPQWKMAGFFRLDRHSPLVFFTYIANPFRWIYLIVARMLRR
jgi:hypothetical protein